jgi:hypothetical protein
MGKWLHTSEGVSAARTMSLSCVDIGGIEANVGNSANVGRTLCESAISPTGDGIFAMKSNDIVSKSGVACALGGAAEEEMDCTGSEGDALVGDGAGGFPPPMRLLERVAFGGMFS